MPRQVLTFVFVFGIVMLLMKACAPTETLPPAITTYSTPAVEETTYTLPNGVVLAADGSIVSITKDNVAVVRPVHSTQRTLQVALSYKNGKKPIPASVWSTTEVAGGREFVFQENDLKVTKRFRHDGDTLSMTITVSGAPDTIVGLEIGAASGVVLSRPGETEEASAFDRLSGSTLFSETFDSLLTQREQERARLLKQLRDDKEVKPVYYKRKLVDPGQGIERFGVLGKNHYLLIEKLAAAHAISTDIYRLKRDGDEENQIETWVSVDLANGQYQGEFKLRWGTRAELAKIEPALASKETRKAAEFTLENDTMRVVLSDRGASIQSLWLKKYTLKAGQDPGEDTWIPLIRDTVPVRHRSLSLYADPQSYGARLSLDVWDTVLGSDNKSIKFHLKTSNGYEFEKIVRLPEEGQYDLGVTVRVTRPSGNTNPKAVFSLTGPAGTYIEDSYRGIIGAEQPTAFLLERDGGEDADEIIDSIAKESEVFAHTYEEDFARGLLRAVGVRGAFFNCALVTEERLDSQSRPAGHVKEARVHLVELTRAVRRPDGDSSRKSLKGLITCAVPYVSREATGEYRLYAGPNRRSDLKHLQIEEAVDFGFFGGIGRLLMWLMKSLQGLFGSFGVAIIFMTLIVRAILMPVSYRTQLGMMRYSKRIQKIKPQLDALEKRYGKDRRKLNEERMKVMRENKVGFPLGCLMIFFQIPIWFALFSALRVEFSLRHEDFLWATDLTMPDRLFPIGVWFIDYFNLLPILMLVLWVIQQKLAPSPGGDDPNVKMQMKMVRFMPYIFFLFLYKYAAALSVYMCVSSAWGIMEAKFVRKAVKRSQEAEGLA